MNEDELVKVLEGELPQKPDRDRMQNVLKKTRIGLAQRQTLMFVLIKIWVAATRILAPFFAMTVKQHAATTAKNPSARKDN